MALHGEHVNILAAVKKACFWNMYFLSAYRNTCIMIEYYVFRCFYISLVATYIIAFFISIVISIILIISIFVIIIVIIIAAVLIITTIIITGFRHFCHNDHFHCCSLSLSSIFYIIIIANVINIINIIIVIIFFFKF
jgi:hypothetical protein